MGDQASLTRSCHASLYLNSVSRDTPGIEVLLYTGVNTDAKTWAHLCSGGRPMLFQTESSSAVGWV